MYLLTLIAEVFLTNYLHKPKKENKYNKYNYLI